MIVLRSARARERPRATQITRLVGITTWAPSQRLSSWLRPRSPRWCSCSSCAPKISALLSIGRQISGLGVPAFPVRRRKISVGAHPSVVQETIRVNCDRDRAMPHFGGPPATTTTCPRWAERLARENSVHRSPGFLFTCWRRQRARAFATSLLMLWAVEMRISRWSRSKDLPSPKDS